jgi:hypothetical protein
MRGRVLAAGLALVAVSGLAGSAGAASRATETVSLAVARTIDAPTGTWKYRFSGAVSSGAASEEVTVMHQVCGYPPPGTAVAGTQTRAGGTWDAEPVVPAQIALSGTFRARWRNETSTAVVIRPQLPVYIIPLGKGRIRFSVTISSVNQKMNGKAVVLERLRNKKWTVVRRARLRFDGSSFGNFATSFTAPRGWVVRGRVPRTVAAPCFKSNATEKVKVA